MDRCIGFCGSAYWIRTFFDLVLAATVSLNPAEARTQMIARAASLNAILALRFFPDFETVCRQIVFDKLASVAQIMERWGKIGFLIVPEGPSHMSLRVVQTVSAKTL